MRTFFLLCLALLFGASPLLTAQETITEQLERERLQQTGTAITIIFDDSGSMNAENKLSQAKAAFANWLKTIPADYKLSLITFTKGGRILVPLGENNREAVTRSVANLVAASSTPICQALRLAARQIEDRRQKITPYERNVVLLFTDGQETDDKRGIEGVRQTIAELRAARIEVAGVGFHGQGDYMNGIATHYYEANDEKSLTQGLAKIDAEIGDTGEIVVSPEELADLKKLSPSPILKTADPAMPTPATFTPPAPRKELKLSTIFLVIIGIFALRSIFRKKK